MINRKDMEQEDKEYLIKNYHWPDPDYFDMV